MPSLTELKSPNVDNLDGWVFAKKVQDLKPRSDPVQGEFSDHQFTTCQFLVLHELVLLGNTRCAICGGWGHSYKLCLTDRKLRNFSKTQMAKTIIKRTREAAIEANSYVGSGKK